MICGPVIFGGFHVICMVWVVCCEATVGPTEGGAVDCSHSTPISLSPATLMDVATNRYTRPPSRPLTTPVVPIDELCAVDDPVENVLTGYCSTSS